MRTSLIILAASAVCILLTQYALATFFHSHRRRVPRSARVLLALTALIPAIFLGSLGIWHTWNTALSSRQAATIQDAIQKQSDSLKATLSTITGSREMIATIDNPQATTSMQSLALERKLRTLSLVDKNGTILASPLQPDLVGTPSYYAEMLPSIQNIQSGISTSPSQQNVTLTAISVLPGGKGYVIATKDIEPVSRSRFAALLAVPNQLIVPVSSYKLSPQAGSATLIDSVIPKQSASGANYRVIGSSWYTVRTQSVTPLSVSQPIYLLIVAPTVFPLAIVLGIVVIVGLILAYTVVRKRVRLKELPGVLYLLIVSLVFSGVCVQLVRKGFYNRYTLKIEQAKPVLNGSLGFSRTIYNGSKDAPLNVSILMVTPGTTIGRVQGALSVNPPGSAELSLKFVDDSCPIHTVKDNGSPSLPFTFDCIPPRVPFKKQNVTLGTLTVTPRTTQPFTLSFDPSQSLMYTVDGNRIYAAFPPTYFLIK